MRRNVQAEAILTGVLALTVITAAFAFSLAIGFALAPRGDAEAAVIAGLREAQP